jgi:hypothetical protein
MCRNPRRGSAAIVFGLALMVAATMARASASESGAAVAAASLEQMARTAFGDLSQAELTTVRTAPLPQIAWASPVQDPAAPINNLAKAETWGKERTLRADLLAWLLTDAQASKLVHPSGIGVAGARVAGRLDLSYQSVNLPLTLIDSSIPDGVDISFANIRALDLRRSWVGQVFGDQSIVHSDVMLTFGRYGDVSFYRAEIDGNLDCRGGRFIGDDPVSAIQATIKGDALLQEGFETGGVVDFRLSKVAQSLDFKGAKFTGKGDNGLNAERAVIGGVLYWDEVRTTPRTQLDLENAHAGSLWDDRQSWPAPGNLMLNGFVYDSFSGGPLDGGSRLDWLALQPPAMQAQPQPYRQLAQIMRESGRPEAATRAEVARENALTEYGGVSFGTRVWRTALWATIGYGYRPLRALWWILLFVVMGTMLFRWGYNARLIAPTEERAYESFVKNGVPPRHYPPFSSFIYSLENFLPVVDLHQGAYWRPNPFHKHEPRGPALKWAGETIPATLLRWYLWVHILAGWTITPLLFAGLSGLLRSD